MISLEEAVHQITGRQATYFGLVDRGLLKPGYHADVVVFDPVGYTPRADYIRPREPSAGVSALFVNGKLALKDGAVTGAAAGRALLRPRPANCGE